MQKSKSHKISFNKFKHNRYSIINSDASKALKNLKDNNLTFKLIMTSPPYNVGKEYETKASMEDYLNAQETIIDNLLEVLDENGSICWQVGNYIEDREVFPLDFYYYNLFKKKGLCLRNRIIWYFGHGLHTSRRFSGRYETILWFTKSDNYIFNLDPVRIPAKYPGKRYSKGPKRGMPSSSINGKNPSDIWEIVVRDWEQELWNIPNVKANHPEKTFHPCQYPIELAERCILALTNPDDYVLDPFNGVGSTALAALKNGRNAVGIEKYKKYSDLALKRIELLKNNELKTRPVNKPIHIPSPNDKVAQIPKEWLTKIV